MNKTINNTAGRASIINGASKDSKNKAIEKQRTLDEKTNTKQTAIIKAQALRPSNRLSTAPIARKMVVSRVSMPRLPRISKRRSSVHNRNPVNNVTSTAISNATRKTINPKSSNPKPIVADDAGSSLFAKPTKSSDKFHCKTCGMTFFYHTSLAAHQKSHSITNSCKYCSRHFALQTALSQHLRDNCVKIPIADRKKLLQNDQKSPGVNRTMRKTLTTPKTTSSTNKLLDLVYKSCSPSDVDRLKAMEFQHYPRMTGIRNTPRKLINCYHCGEKFKDPCSYAIHVERCVPENGGSRV